jgi:hypothetical protein
MGNEEIRPWFQLSRSENDVFSGSRPLFAGLHLLRRQAEPRLNSPSQQLVS